MFLQKPIGHWGYGLKRKIKDVILKGKEKERNEREEKGERDRKGEERGEERTWGRGGKKQMEPSIFKTGLLVQRDWYLNIESLLGSLILFFTAVQLSFYSTKFFSYSPSFNLEQETMSIVYLEKYLQGCLWNFCLYLFMDVVSWQLAHPIKLCAWCVPFHI